MLVLAVLTWDICNLPSLELVAKAILPFLQNLHLMATPQEDPSQALVRPTTI